MAKKQLDRRALRLALYVTVPSVFLLVLTSAHVRNDQFCMQCGAQRWTNTVQVGLGLIRLTTSSGEVEATALSRLHDKISDPCTQHSWRNHHGYGRWLVLGRFTFSGGYPVRLESFESDLERVGERDIELVRDIVDHITTLNESGDWKQMRVLEREMLELARQSSPLPDKHLGHWKLWWREYKQRLANTAEMDP